MIGTGSGVAPFLSILQYVETQKSSNSLILDSFRSRHLVFGCKNSKEDFVYRPELEKWINSKVLDNLWCAFSRDQVS